MTGQEATVIDVRQEADALASWPTRERLRALKRIIPRARVEDALARCGHDRAVCPRLPGWFMVWFIIALGLFCRDCYRQVFRWLQPFRPNANPPRSTFCEARQRLGVAPLRHLAHDTVRLLGRPETPGAFYRGLRLMALDGFTVDVPDTPRNDRAFGQVLRITFLGYLSQDLQQVVVPPAGEMTSSVDALGFARRLGLEQAQRQLSDPCQVRRTVASPVALIVLAEADIQHPVQ